MLKRIKQRRKYKKKYKRELGWDEKFTHFAIKTVGLVTLFFITAISIDAYHLFHH